jgi:endonuclease YncB( thermonuclease family)
MRKVVGVVVMTVAVLLLSRYGPALHAWTRTDPERLATSGPAERPVRGEAHAAAVRPGASSGITARVMQIVDGDTITVRMGGRTEIVKYIGVVASGPAAEEINHRLLAGSEVRLELDMVERDKAGRLLAYVHVGEVMMNAELVAQGAARVTADSPNGRHQHLLRDLEHQAKILKVGIWGARAPRG